MREVLRRRDEESRRQTLAPQGTRAPVTARRARQAALSAPVLSVRRLHDLDAIFDEEAEAVIWNRQPPPSIASALKALPAHEVENGRYCTPIGGVGDCIADLFSAWGWRAGDAQDWLAEDVEALAGRMAQILSVSHLLLRVELVRDDACRKFHRDMVRARLICTYSGPGTELGLAEDGDRSIGAVPTGSPILLKGKRWPGAARGSLLHRSPPIEARGLSRLVVVLNEAPSDIG